MSLYEIKRTNKNKIIQTCLRHPSLYTYWGNNTATVSLNDITRMNYEREEIAGSELVWKNIDGKDIKYYFDKCAPHVVLYERIKDLRGTCEAADDAIDACERFITLADDNFPLRVNLSAKTNRFRRVQEFKKPTDGKVTVEKEISIKRSTVGPFVMNLSIAREM